MTRGSTRFGERSEDFDIWVLCHKQWTQNVSSFPNLTRLTLSNCSPISCFIILLQIFFFQEDCFLFSSFSSDMLLFELFLEGALTICFHGLDNQFFLFFSSWSAIQMKACLHAASLHCSKYESQRSGRQDSSTENFPDPSIHVSHKTLIYLVTCSLYHLTYDLWLCSAKLSLRNLNVRRLEQVRAAEEHKLELAILLNFCFTIHGCCCF